MRCVCTLPWQADTSPPLMCAVIGPQMLNWPSAATSSLHSGSNWQQRLEGPESITPHSKLSVLLASEASLMLMVPRKCPQENKWEVTHVGEWQMLGHGLYCSVPYTIGCYWWGWGNDTDKCVSAIRNKGAKGGDAIISNSPMSGIMSSFICLEWWELNGQTELATRNKAVPPKQHVKQTYYAISVNTVSWPFVCPP